MPLPDDKQRLIFYRESKDGCFCSYRGSHFYVVDGQLYLTYQYQMGRKEWIATPVPETLSSYFCELVKDFDEINKETATNEENQRKVRIAGNALQQEKECAIITSNPEMMPFFGSSWKQC